MGGSFIGLNMSMRGLYASQSALNITNENISNTSTEGYVRRVASFKSVALSGTKGVDVEAIRMRDSYLDTKVWNQNSVASEWKTKETYYNEIMEIIDEPSDVSISTVISEFFGGFQELAKDPSSITNRNVVLQKSAQFTDFLNNMAINLENYQSTLNDNIKTQVGAINNIAEEIATLNRQIYNTEISGGDASTQKDQLEAKIKELSEYGDVEVIETEYGELINGKEDKRITVMFGGTVLINHDSARQLEYTKMETKTNPEDIDGLYKITTKEGTALNLSSGKLKATLELRDGTGQNGDWVKGVPYYLRELNKFTKTFVKAFNEGIIDYNNDGDITTDEKTPGYADGYVYNSVEGDEIAGIRFFSTNGQSTTEFLNGATALNDINALYENVTAKNLTLSEDVINNVGNIFSSLNSPINKNDTDSILELLDFRENSKIFGTGDIDNFVEGLVTNIGLDANTASDINESHQVLLEELENRRSSYSDVSIDEEVTNLVIYQQLYNASAKTMSIFQELYDTLLGAI